MNSDVADSKKLEEKSKILSEFNQLNFPPEDIDIVVYHKHCFDGSASALAAFLYSKENNLTY
jgi:hypothetical protein